MTDTVSVQETTGKASLTNGGYTASWGQRKKERRRMKARMNV